LADTRGDRASWGTGKKLKFSVGLGGPLAEVLQRAFRAEELNFDIVWIPDHLTDIPPATAIYDAWTVLAFIGARTKRIMLGSGVTDIQRMHPAKTASTVASLDNLTGGRAILGIGAGEVMNTKPFGMEWEPTEKRVQRMREYIEVAQLLWKSSYEKQVGFDGDYYSFKEAHLSLRPLQKPRPPVHVGAFGSTAMLKVTGEVADGWYPGSCYSPKSFKEKVGLIQEVAASFGRKRGAVEMLANIPVVFADDNKTKSIVRESFKRSLVINRYILKLLGEDEAYDMVSKRLSYQLIAPTPAYARILDKTVRELPVSVETLDRGIGEMMAVGTPAECVEKIARFVKAGATTINLSFVVDNDDTLETFGKKVIPALRA